jgi:DNA gyrase/topoisomerase IV subunit A
MSNLKDRQLTIPEQINQDYRKYALYVIQSRGIPNFYDCLTPVQRLILQKAPTSSDKTIGVVGEVFKTKLYHHGDASLSSAISKLARPFGCADTIMEGDGFFGSPVNPTPAAARYTSVKISPRYKSIIDEHKDLNVPNEEGGFDWLHVTFPIGLMTHIVGIAVGYRSNILPRKYEDVIAYLNGDKERKLKPYFKGFKGKISKVDSLKSAWLIEGLFSSDPKTKTITINGLSPLSRFESFNDKLHKVLVSSGVDYKVENRSKDEVEVTIKIKASDDQFEYVSNRIKKETQHIVTENIIIVKDGSVLEYSSVEEYLEQFSVHKEEVLFKRISKDGYYNDRELEFFEAKLKFLNYMMQKKRTAEEITEFLKPFVPWIRTRLESIPLIKLSSNEVEITKTKIEECKNEAKSIKIKVKEQELKWKSALKVWNLVSKKNLKQSSLMIEGGNEGSYNGIQIWNPEEYLQEEEKILTGDEENETDEETNQE